MAKLLLLSIVMAMIVLPVVAAREATLKRGLAKVLVLMVAFNLLYLFAVRFIYPRLQ